MRQRVLFFRFGARFVFVFCFFCFFFVFFLSFLVRSRNVDSTAKAGLQKDASSIEDAHGASLVIR